MKPPIKGVLTSTTPVPVSVMSLSCPFTITLNSSAVGRKIELSTDDLIGFVTPVLDPTSTSTKQVVSVQSPVTHVQFTGQAGDTWVMVAT